MSTLFKQLLNSEKDSHGININRRIRSLSLQTKTNEYEWSYLKDDGVYENTSDGSRIYPYEIADR